ncbi:hypothetical protein ATK36_3914 [Amycolatopsis sulphurea]|uniref:Uncharacterized protein n=1 Tax=Amycolatopsis sulphurea TaxID=76022 RepID=A0A2A9FCX7_9PSEU|nr:hypothetical protein ATK36_3914 [Amycolatopsis sulphurea]
MASAYCDGRARPGTLRARGTTSGITQWWRTALVATGGAGQVVGDKRRRAGHRRGAGRDRPQQATSGGPPATSGAGRSCLPQAMLGGATLLNWRQAALRHKRCRARSAAKAAPGGHPPQAMPGEAAHHQRRQPGPSATSHAERDYSLQVAAGRLLRHKRCGAKSLAEASPGGYVRASGAGTGSFATREPVGTLATPFTASVHRHITLTEPIGIPAAQHLPSADSLTSVDIPTYRRSRAGHPSSPGHIDPPPSSNPLTSAQPLTSISTHP